MTLIRDTVVGRYNTDATEVMNHVRKPVFVDNAVHYGRLSVQRSGKPKVTVERNMTRTLQVMPEREYTLVEGESDVQLTHKSADGHSYSGTPYFGTDVISNSNQPKLLYNVSNYAQRLVGDSITDRAVGILIGMKNMKGRTLQSIGFDGDGVRLGQPVGVGLRTSDLAVRLGEAATNGTTSVGLSRPRNTSTSYRNHSTRFVGQDFNNSNLMTALRFLGRHDSRIVLLDRFGNLLYVPVTFSESNIEINNDGGLGTLKESPVDNTTNAVTIQGLPLALNDMVIVTVSDAEGQVEEIREDPSPIVDHTVRSTNTARRTARQILKGQSLTKGALTSSGNENMTHVRPGTVIRFNGKNKVVTEVVHKPLESISDFTMLNIETGLEGVLQGIGESSTVLSNNKNPSTYVQRVESNLSFFGEVDLIISAKVTSRRVEATAILIGGVKGTRTRGKIGGNGLPIGVTKGPEEVN
jgi:hypothetical protein